MESGPIRVNAPLEGPVIPRSRRILSKTKASGIGKETMQTPMQTGGMQELHAKEEVGRGGGAHRGWYSVGGRGEGERLWVSAWCLGEV